MENAYTEQRCIIGSCCIKKFATKKQQTQMKINIGKKEGKRYCNYCNRKLPDDFEKWKTYHKKCYWESPDFKNKLKKSMTFNETI